MNYTEKYHLPQWEKTDRIMMEDFNQMCADMEAGLDAGQADCRERTAELKDETLDGMFRAAWNHYHLAAAGTMPRQIGVFRQVFDGSTPVGNSGLMQKDGYAWMTWDGEGFTPQEFQEGLSIDSELMVYANDPGICRPLIISFTAKGAGRLEKLSRFLSYYSSGTGTNTFILTVTDLTTGQTIDGTSLTQTDRVNTSLNWLYIYPNINLQTGHKYQVKVEVDQASYMVQTRSDDKVFASVVSYHAAEAEVSHQFAEPDASAGGLFFVRYNLTGTGNSVNLQWNGEDVQPLRVQTVTDGKGRRVTEAEYRRKGEAPAGSTVRLRLHCARKAEVALYEWGGILI